MRKQFTGNSQEQGTGLFLQYDFDYTPDNANNLTTIRNQDFSFNDNNQIVGTGFSWDGDGNPGAYLGNSLTFDGENHLTSLDNSGFNYIRANYRDDGLRNSKRSINSSDGNALPTYYNLRRRPGPLRTLRHARRRV